MIEQSVHGGNKPTLAPPKSCPFQWGLNQRMGSAKMAESIEMLFRGLIRAPLQAQGTIN